MSWLANNLGSSINNLAGRINSEVNAENQHAMETTLQHLNQQLTEAREELFARNQDWERAKHDYETRLQAVGHDKQKADDNLARAVGILKNLKSDKEALLAKVATLEARLNAIESSTTEKHNKQHAAPNGKDNKDDGNIALKQQQEKADKELKAVQELYEQKIKTLNDRLTDSLSKITTLETAVADATAAAASASQQGDSDALTELSIQLEMAKEDLELSEQETARLKEENQQISKRLASSSATPPSTPGRAASVSGGGDYAELQVSKKEVAALKAQIQQIQQEHVKSAEKDRSTAENAQQAHEAEKRELQAKVDDLQDALKKLQEEAIKGGDVNGTHDDCAIHQERIQELESQMSNVDAASKKLHSSILSQAAQALLDSTKRDTIAASVQDNKTLSVWNQAVADYDHQKNNAERLNSAIEALKSDAAQAEANNHRHLERMKEEHKQELTEVRLSLETAIAQQTAKIQSSSSSDQKAQLKSIQEQATQNIRHLEQKQEAEKQALMGEISSQKQEFQALSDIQSSLRAELDMSKQSQAAALKELEAQKSQHESVLQALNQNLQQVMSERDQIQASHRGLLDRVNNMRSTLNTRLQADMDNVNTLTQQAQALKAQNADYQSTIRQLEDELLASHEHYEKTSRELEHLRKRLVDIQDEAAAEVADKEGLIHELESRLQREESEREDWESMAMDQRGSKDQAIAAMRSMERERNAALAEKNALRQELDRETENLTNLQSVLEEFQASKESDIRFALEGLHKQLSIATKSLEEYKERASAAEENLSHLSLDVDKARQLEREVKEKNITIGKLRHEAVIQQGHLTEAMRRLKEEDSQNMVDIPLISNLFISFLNIPRGDQKRFEILQLISGVLKFTDEQREQAGLIRKASGLGSMTPTTSGSRSPSMEQIRQHEPKESFIDMWASFLIRESNTNAAAGRGTSPKSPS